MSKISSFQHFSSLFQLLKRKVFVVYFNIDENSLQNVLLRNNRELNLKYENSLDGSDEWIVENESCFEHLLNCISFLHPYSSQLLLANYSLKDLICETNHLEHCLIEKKIFNELDDIFSVKF